MKSAIFGSAGQDGSILAGQLESAGESVIRIGRRDSGDPLGDPDWGNVLRREKPDCIYYLAAHHRSSEQKPDDFASEWIQSFRIHLEGWIRILETVRKHLPETRLLFASSAHVFGEPAQVPQSEATPMIPTCAYGCSKLAGMQVGLFYRKEHQMHVSNVILFPHESIHRGPMFLSKKLLRAAQEASRNPDFRIEIGDPDAVCDWGYAPEYTLAMKKVLSLDQPHDFVVATGQGNRVADFAEGVFSSFGLDWRQHVIPCPSLLTKPSRKYIGDAGKLFEKTGYRPKMTLPELAEQLVHDLRASS